MTIEHLESYEIALIIWSFLFLLLGLQGLISIYLEGETNFARRIKAHGGSWWTVLITVVLTAGVVWFSWQFVYGLFNGGTPEGLSQLAGLVALLLAVLVGIYRKSFVDDVVVEQERTDDVPW